MNIRKLALAGSLALALLLQTAPALAVSYSGATTISASTTESGQSYSSTTANQNALLVTGGTSTLTNPTVTKSGSPSGRSDDYDFYGTNAAVLVNSGATLTIEGGTVATDGSYANAVYANGTGKINISGTSITTKSNNSGGIMVTGGGTLNAENLTVTTSGGSSAAIRSDKGGGTITVTGGTYSTSGSGSPAIYSTADITVNGATLTSTAAEGVVIEGGNSVTLNNVTLTDTNSTLNGQSTTYKNVFLYQSMSGDASSGGGSFTATDSTITTNKGDSFFVTNNTATITLTNNAIVNNDAGYFLRAQAGAWGSSGSNGGSVTLTLDNQVVTGDIYIDNISTLTMVLKNGSSFTGTINGDNTAKSIAVTLSADSSITLTGDSYVYSLTNADSTGRNIVTNGYTLTTNAGSSGGDNVGTTGSGQTPPEKPGDEGNAPDDGQTPPDKPDGEGNAPGDGTTPPEKPAGETAPAVQISSQTATLNGEAVEPQIYNIDAYNYFRLRDLAMLLRDTGARFEVAYDEASRTISVSTGAAYTPVGGEMEQGADLSDTCVRSSQQLVINGTAVSLDAYNLGGSNYFKLRDLGDALGFGVDYDEGENTAIISTG